MCAHVCFPCFCLGAQQNKEAIESLHETPITRSSSYFQSSLSLQTLTADRVRLTFSHSAQLSCPGSSALIDCVNEWVKDHGELHWWQACEYADVKGKPSHKWSGLRPAQNQGDGFSQDKPGGLCKVSEEAVELPCCPWAQEVWKGRCTQSPWQSN